MTVNEPRAVLAGFEGSDDSMPLKSRWWLTGYSDGYAGRNNQLAIEQQVGSDRMIEAEYADGWRAGMARRSSELDSRVPVRETQP